MEKESQVVEDQSIPVRSPPTTSGPSSSVTWSLPSAPDSPLSRPPPPGPPPPTTGSSAVHALQTKVKTLTQRRQRGRERERDRDNRDKFDSSAVKPVAFDPAGHHHAATSLVPPPTRERARCNKGNNNTTTAPPPFGPTWRRALSPLSKSSSSEEGEEEVEVQVKLEIHSPPPEAPGGVAMGTGEERISDPSDQPRGLGEGASLENLTDSSSSSGKEALPPPPPAAPPPPTPASTSASVTRASAAATTSASPSSSTTSSSTTRHWAPPKGFWRIVRPETLLLNGVPSSSAPLRDHTATQTAAQTASAAAAEPRRKASQSEEATAGGATAVGLGSSAPDDGEAVPPSEFKHSDSLDCYLDRYEQSEAEIVSTMRPVSATALLRVDSAVVDSALLRVDSGLEDSALLRVDSSVDSSVEDSALLRVDSVVEDSVLLRVDSGVEDSALLRVDSGVEDSESSSAQSGPTPSNDERAEEARQRACRRPAVKERQRQHTGREEGEQSSGRYGDEAPCKVDCKDDQASDSSIPPQELGQCPRSLIGPEYELALSPRHEQAKRLLERARLKARSKGDRPTRRSQSDQRCHTKRQSAGPAATPARQPQTADLLLTPAPLEIQDPSSAAADLGGLQPPRSPTRVRFEDESEKEAESRYLDRQRDRGRPGGGAAAAAPKTKNKAESNNPDCSDSGSDRGRSRHGGVSMPPALKEEDATAARCHVTTVIKEVIVLVKKCEACGSVVREPASAPLPEAQTSSAVEPQQLLGSKAEETQAKTQAPSRPEASSAARPKAPLTVTFAGAFVLGESKDSEGSETRRNSEFGKLRRRSRKGSRKGESGRLESGHGPYGPSWARRNSNPRSRAGGGAGGKRRAVSFAPGRPVAVDPRSLGGGGLKPAPPTQSLPIKSALKSSSKNRSEGSNPYSPLAESQGQRGGEVSKALSQGGTPMTTCLVPCVRPSTLRGTPVTTCLVPCVRPSTLRYSEARLTTDLPSSELWDATPNGTGMTLSDFGQRALVLSRPEDLRAELLRSEHLKAEVHWEETSDGSRKLVAERDGRPKLSLRRFLSSIGLNSVGRLVKSSAHSSSMEQLSIPAPPPRASSASPTRRPPDPNIRRRPSLQTMHSSHTVFPLAQLRKASSVQSLERRTERSTILGEVQLPYGLAPSPESPQMEEAVVVRPVGRVSQAFPDGTLLLELTRPPNGPFGFVISRGKGRSDASGKTGVYVEKVGDGGSGGEGLYVGLLGVGDEILEVNGEAVAGFSLDQVTRLLTRDSTAFIRTAPASSRRNQRWPHAMQGR